MEPVTFSGPAGNLEGRWETPPSPARFVGVMGHPHPAHGGTMQNNVVVRAARAMVARGGAILRFNFRGVGRSEGSYDEGRGESTDYTAAIQFVRARQLSPLLIAAGFSFGSMRAYECAGRGEAERYLGIAPPLREGQQPDSIPCPAALVVAGADELVPAPSADELGRRFPDLRSVKTVDGSGHLFTGRLDDLVAAVDACLDVLLDS